MSLQTYEILPSQNHSSQKCPSKIPLHGLDRLSPPIQIHNHRFYKNPPIPVPGLIDKLKSSLAEALELYHPISGTFEINEEGEAYILTGQEYTIPTPFLVETRDTAYTADSQDLSPRLDMILPAKSSILAVKLTQFSCSTICLASSINHCVTDCHGFLDFLELWAQICREEPIDFTKIPTDWTRTPKQYFTTSLEDTKTIDPVPNPPPFKTLKEPVTGPPEYLLRPSSATRWKFTRQSLQKLKSNLSPSPSNGWISTGDALAALVSSVITRARRKAGVPRLQGRSSTESQVERIAMAANGRYRAISENMSNGQYFGNFNNLWSTDVCRNQLESEELESTATVALCIRKKLNTSLSSKAIANRITYFEQNSSPPGHIYWSADIILTNWCLFDLKGPKLDIGWGKPFYASDGAGVTFPPGYSLMIQDHDSGDVSVLITVENEAANDLKVDHLLNEYATEIALIPNA